MDGDTVSKKNKQLTYIKSNDLIQMRGAVIRRDPLSETKRKIIALEASKVQETDTPDTVYTLTAKELIDLCGVEKNGRTYEQIFAEIYDLKTKTIAFVNKRGKISIESYMDKIEIDRENGNATYKIPEALLPHFKRYAQFTKLDLIEYMPLRGQYALLLYELLMSWREKGEVYYTLDQLRQLLEVPEGAYPRTADLLRYTVYEPLKQVNQRLAGKKIKYELKHGYRRKVEGVTFFIPKVKDEKTAEPPTLAALEAMGQTTILDAISEQAATVTPDLRAEVQIEIAAILGDEEAAAMFKKYGEGYCAANLAYSRKHAKKDLAAYFRKALAANYAKYINPASEAAAVAEAGKPKIKKPNPNCPKCRGEGYFEVNTGDERYSSKMAQCDCWRFAE